MKHLLVNTETSKPINATSKNRVKILAQLRNNPKAAHAIQVLKDIMKEEGTPEVAQHLMTRIAEGLLQEIRDETKFTPEAWLGLEPDEQMLALKQLGIVQEPVVTATPSKTPVKPKASKKKAKKRKAAEAADGDEETD